MVKSIHLKLDNELFYKLKADKLKCEKADGSMTWERYIARLFGLANVKIRLERRNNGKNKR